MLHAALDMFISLSHGRKRNEPKRKPPAASPKLKIIRFSLRFSEEAGTVFRE
jgi:hypothetical protein